MPPEYPPAAPPPLLDDHPIEPTVAAALARAAAAAKQAGKHAAPDETAPEPDESDLPRMLIYLGALVAAIVLAFVLLVPALTGGVSSPSRDDQPSPVAAAPTGPAGQPVPAGPAPSGHPALAARPVVASPSAAAGRYTYRYSPPRLRSASSSPAEAEHHRGGNYRDDYDGEEYDWNADDWNTYDWQNGETPWWWRRR